MRITKTDRIGQLLEHTELSYTEIGRLVGCSRIYVGVVKYRLDGKRERHREREREFQRNYEYARYHNDPAHRARKLARHP